jgi:hypothetical protein
MEDCCDAEYACAPLMWPYTPRSKQKAADYIQRSRAVMTMFLGGTAAPLFEDASMYRLGAGPLGVSPVLGKGQGLEFPSD